MLPYRDAFSLPEKFKRPHLMPPAEVNGQLHDFLVAEDDAPTIPAAEKVAAAQSQYQEIFSAPAENGTLHLFSRKP